VPAELRRLGAASVGGGVCVSCRQANACGAVDVGWWRALEARRGELLSGEAGVGQAVMRGRRGAGIEPAECGRPWSGPAGARAWAVGRGEQERAPCAGSSWSEEALAMGKASERMRGRAGF
jgi:hypothetical protein